MIIILCPSPLLIKVLSLMIPLRYDLIKFGGSWAQRQVFELTLIMVRERERRVGSSDY